MIDFHNKLLQFSPIFLEDMGSVKLMNRTDTKYLLHIDQLGEVLDAALGEHLVLEINGKRIMGYESLYFDTPDHRMYILHHNKKLNRYKVRIRQYLDSKDFFLEVKFKNNKGRTSKKRITISGNDAISESASVKFIEKRSPFSPSQIEPKLNTKFERITLVNPEKKERITIDMNLTFHNSKESIKIPYLVIVEVKREINSDSDGFGQLLREQRIFKKRISKYCLGTNLLYPEKKHNRFKPKILYLKKLDKSKHYDQLYSKLI
ncbi:MAG: polyphosphate polymerase domain-containing protein [Bacteroidales bacterium]|nr:polyphosphate polymerase domain-containing protein [Bacteroidales bacterium]